MLSLKTLAQRCVELQRERDKLEVELDAMVTAVNPGCGPPTPSDVTPRPSCCSPAGGNSERLCSEAAVAALCGVSPIPASSGEVTRHRLSRGGDRAANSALYRIALVRMASDQRTKEYVARQRQAGRSTGEIMRLLKRAIAREVFRYLTTPVVVPAVDDLRPLRQSKNITLTAAANELGVWPIRISEIERVSAGTTTSR